VGSTFSEDNKDSSDPVTDGGGGGDGKDIPDCRFITEWYDTRITMR